MPNSERAIEQTSLENVNRPDFFIVGAPRSGTTALSEYLRSHPEVFVSTPKEPNYFSFDMNRPRHAAGTLEEYLGLFSNANGRIAGEASVWYLYSKVAIPEILRFNSNAKIIVMVRNPIDWVCSWHAQRLFTLNEDEPDIEVAWRKQWERKEGRFIPDLCTEPELLQYRDAAMFGTQVERTFQVVPNDQIQVIVFDDFANETRKVYESVLSFLSVPSDGRTDFPRIHPTKRHRSVRLAHMLKRPPLPMRAAFKSLRILGVDDNRLRSQIRSWNTATGYSRSLRSAFKRELAETFASDVEKLGRLLGRDFSHWLEV